ncbi:MAG: carboxypeptidase-like regulatory domain-containing protein [Bryobacteraceae bacterium]
MPNTFQTPQSCVLRVTNIVCFLAILFIALLPSMMAQNNQFGTIQGTVTDQSGAPAPGATVTLTSPALVVTQTTTSDGSGNYHFEQLPVGIYRISATLAGFQQYIRENIQISAGFTATINVQLSVGSQTDTVTVSSEGPVVDIKVHYRLHSGRVDCGGGRNPRNANHAGNGLDRARRHAYGRTRLGRRQHRLLCAISVRNHWTGHDSY